MWLVLGHRHFPNDPMLEVSLAPLSIMSPIDEESPHHRSAPAGDRRLPPDAVIVQTESRRGGDFMLF